MCGIAGIYSLQERPVPEAALAAMNASLLHRGPDDAGMLCDAGVGIAMRRLSIVGVGNGHQPLFNEDQSVAVVMNGEIYNHPDLRAGLAERGHVLQTSTDVEVAVHLYEEEGGAFVRHLRGMFAYAVYDRRARRLHLGRDRAGKKPLYYAVANGYLLFASEIKALFASGLLDKALDVHALESYLAHGFVIGVRTLFAGVRKLPPGCTLEIGGGEPIVRRYWEFPQPQPQEAGDAVERVRQLLDESVRIRLMSEVPLGAFLSGGVDSSAVVALMSRHMGEPVETFAVGFNDPQFDELAYARVAAEAYGSRHHELLLNECRPELLRTINWFHDEPAADPAIVPTFCLSRFARQWVTVALTGEGGDELFAGYRHYRLNHALGALEAHVGGTRPLAAWLSRLEPSANAWGPRRLWKGLWIAQLPAADRPRALLSVFTDPEIARLLTPEMRAANGDGYHLREFRQLQQRAAGADAVAQSMYVDANSQLPEQLLMKVDKMTMAASLEARCPLLDQELIAYVATLPTAMKLSGAGTKLLLRRALQGLVPDVLLDRPKHGFEVPVRRWLLGDLRGLVQELLLSGSAPTRAYLAPGAVHGLWRGLQARADHFSARQMWLLLNFAVWHEQHWSNAEVPAHHVAA